MISVPKREGAVRARVVSGEGQQQRERRTHVTGTTTLLGQPGELLVSESTCSGVKEIEHSG